MLIEVVTSVGALLGTCGGVYSVIVSRSAREASTRKTAGEAAHVEDKTWIARLEALDKQFTKLQALSDERFNKIIEIEIAITEHVQWDHAVVREARKVGLHIPDPPSLDYIKRLAIEAKTREVEGRQILDGNWKPELES
jgi:hypothetical protein